MSKLEKELERLEYFKHRTTYYDFSIDGKPYIYFEKPFCERITICVVLYDNEIDDYYLEHDYDTRIYRKQSIINLQEAFDLMEKDLEVLRNVESER